MPKAQDNPMTPQRSNRPTLIVEVQGGLVTAVYSDAPLKVLLLDWDTEGSLPGAPDLVYVPSRSGEIQQVDVVSVTFPEVCKPSKLPANVRQALEKAGYLPPRRARIQRGKKSAGKSSERRKGRR